MMRERREVVRLWQAEGADVVVTLVGAQGSSYRRPGARLLLSRTRETVGTISGGCLEAEVVRRAAWLTREGARVERYSMEFDDTSEIPFGLGCGGSVDLLYEPAGTPEADALLLAMERSLAGQPTRVVHFLPDGTRPLRRLIVDHDGEVIFRSEALADKKIECARQLAPGPYEGRFVEELGCPQRLIVFGAGDDARPLAAFAAQLGWSVTIVDGRSQLARPERFPEAERVIVAEDLGQVRVTARDAVVLMTHSYEQDRNWLRQVLPMRPQYLGLLGSRHRSSLLVSEAALELDWTVDACCRLVFAPVGMDLGGDGAESIALSILAEALAITQGKHGNPRRLQAEDVAEQIRLGGASLYLQAQCALG